MRATMRAQQLAAFDGPAALQIDKVPVPGDPSAVVVEVHAAGVGFPDVLLTYGRYQDVPPLPYTPGLEVAGYVARAPEGSGLTVGQRVAGATTDKGGAFAEYAAVMFAYPIPEEMDFVRGAAATVNYHTAHFSLRRRARLQAGETVLVRGAAGGLGTAAIQVAKGVGARVLAVAGTEEKRAVARQAGADVVLSTDDWGRAARDETGGRGVDLVYDPVGGPDFTDAMRCLAPDGRVLSVGFAQGEIPSVKLNRLLMNNIGILGAVWEPFLAVDPSITDRAVEDLSAWMKDGIVNPVVGSVHPFEDATGALREIEERRATGKVVLRVR